jgi:predicted nucleic acid-binding protein
MRLYLDSSALVKRYVDEEGSDEVEAAMEEARRWETCRIGYVETARALGLRGDGAAADRFQAEWPAFRVVELDLAIAEDAVELAPATALRALDAIHLAAALAIADRDLTVATWDQRLHRAARERGLTLLPESLAA